MHLITNNLVNVTVALGGETITTHVKGTINVETIIPITNMNIGSQYSYGDADNENELIKSGTTVITEDEQQLLYQSVKNTLPDINDNFSFWYKSLLYEAFKIEMAETFSIDPSDISIVP